MIRQSVWILWTSSRSFFSAADKGRFVTRFALRGMSSPVPSVMEIDSCLFSSSLLSTKFSVGSPSRSTCSHSTSLSSEPSLSSMTVCGGKSSEGENSESMDADRVSVLFLPSVTGWARRTASEDGIVPSLRLFSGRFSS